MTNKTFNLTILFCVFVSLHLSHLSAASPSPSKLQEIRNYITHLWPSDTVNTKDICDTFDLCTKGMKVQSWTIDPKNSKKIHVTFAEPIHSELLYKSMPVNFEIKQQLEVEFSQEEDAKVMTFSNEALKGTKIINVYISRVEFDNTQKTPADQKKVTLELSTFVLDRTLVWKLDKLHGILKTIIWPQ